MNLWLHELPETNCVDSDRSLTCEFPLSPSSQLMYESEPLRDQCSGVTVQRDQPRLETGVISPSVEGLMFTDSDVFQYMFASDQLPAAAAAASASSGDEVQSNTAAKYWSDAWQMTAGAAGPTLTQLNSEDLDTTLLDDFSVSSSMDCTRQQQQLTTESNITASVSVRSSTATLPCWSEQMRQPPQETAVQRQHQEHEKKEEEEAVMSHQQHHVESCAQVHHTHCTPSHSASTMQLTLDRCWEAIDSFLKSEDARMAAESSNSQRQVLQLATDIKTEAQGILVFVKFACSVHELAHL